MLCAMTTPGRADAIRKNLRLARDVVETIDRRALAESTTASAVVEAAVRGYGDRTRLDRMEDRLGAIEARLAALEEDAAADGDASAAAGGG